MTLVTSGDKRMASRAVRPDTQGHRQVKLSKSDAARRIATLLDEHMTELGLSEKEKNKRVDRFGKRVDAAIRRHAKRS